MTHYLPPQLLTYFEPRPPLEYLPFNDPSDTKPKTCHSISGVADVFARFQQYAQKPKLEPQPTKQQVKEVHKTNAIKRHQRHLTSRIAKYDPKAPNDKHSADAYKTLFVGRLNYSLTEADIQKEFEYYGPILSCRLVTDPKTGKSRGYAFIQYASSKDLSAAFKDADGRKIAGRRIVVDVERGRTVKNWRPRRLGGGLGGTRNGGRDVNRATSGRDVQAIPDKAKTSSSSSNQANSQTLSRTGIHPDREREREREREIEREREHRRSYREREEHDPHRVRGRSRSPSRHDDRRR